MVSRMDFATRKTDARLPETVLAMGQENAISRMDSHNGVASKEIYTRANQNDLALDTSISLQ